MMDILARLNNEVLRDIKKCKKGKLGKRAGQNWTICKGLECRVFYFEPNKDTIKKWREKQKFYKKGIDRRVIFVAERPGPTPGLIPNDTKVQRCFCVEDESLRPGVARKLERYHKVRKKYGLENCCLTNIVKCSKFEGTDKPDVYEIPECSLHLINEIEIIDPEVVVAVGGFQYKTLRTEPFKAFIEDKGRKLHKITHYAYYGGINKLLERWDEEFSKLKKIISPSPKFIEEVHNYQKESKRIKIEPKEIKTIMWFTSDFFDKDNLEIPKDILNLINSQPYVKKISEIRRQFVDRGAKEVFTHWRIDPGWNHAFTFNKGARSELQANIGIWGKGIKGNEIRSRGIRLGYGFNLNRAGFGDPDKNYKFLNIMMGLLQDNNSVTSKIWKNLSHSLYVEYEKENEERKKTYINFEQLFDWLNTEDAFWLFFGCFIGIEPKDDIPSILDEKKSLVRINEFFEKTLDFYEEVWNTYKLKHM